jgi:basic membrane protein A and related proteins
MRRTWRILALLSVLIVVLAACGSNNPSTGGTTGGTSPTSLPGAGKTVCEVSDSGGFDDKSFNQTAHKGVEEAQADLGVTAKFLESNADSDYTPNIQACLQQNADLVVTVGFLLGDATQAAATANPDRNFAIVDFAYDPPVPNIQGLTFQTDQAAFLAGYLAAGMSQSGKIGTFGGINIPTVTIFMNGLAAGILKYNQDNGTSVQLLGWDPVKQDGTFTGDFTNKDNGKRVAEDLLSEGADIILPVAGPVGLGAAAAVQDAGNASMIWVDVDGCVSAAEFCSLFLTTIEKHIDVAVHDAVKAVIEGTFQGGSNYSGTLENNGVGLAPFHEFDSQVPADLKSKLDELKAGIVDGSISVDPKDYQG